MSWLIRTCRRGCRTRGRRHIALSVKPHHGIVRDTLKPHQCYLNSFYELWKFGRLYYTWTTSTSHSWLRTCLPESVQGISRCRLLKRRNEKWTTSQLFHKSRRTDNACKGDSNSSIRSPNIAVAACSKAGSSSSETTLSVFVCFFPGWYLVLAWVKSHCNRVPLRKPFKCCPRRLRQSTAASYDSLPDRLPPETPNG